MYDCGLAKRNRLCILVICSYCSTFRRRLEYGLVHDPNEAINDENLKDAIQQLRQYQPYCGVSLVWGNLRARGVKVTHENVYGICFASLIPLAEFYDVFLGPLGDNLTLFLD